MPGFGTQYLYNPTGGTTELFVYGLAAHTALRVKFDLVYQDSWDSNTPSFPGPDIMFVNLGGTTYEWTVINGSGSVFDVGPGTVVSTGSNVIGAGFFDTVVRYNFLIPHTADSFLATFRFGGGGFQGGTDESWGLDNWSLSAITASGGVPEPSSWAMLITGFGLVGAAARRRKTAAA